MLDRALRQFEVLVVEDDGEIREVFREFLLSRGYSVRLAADGEEALSLLKDALPTVILTDLNMPKMDGWELLRSLRSDPLLSKIPVAIMTAEERFPAGYRVLKKPFTIDFLLDFLAAHVGEGRPEVAEVDVSPANQSDGED
jgi:CheY-like chemotaxis protein